MRSKESIPKIQRKGTGATIGFIMGGILMFTAVIIYVIVMNATKEVAENSFEDAVCSDSVLYAAGLRMTQINAFAANIKCPTKTVTIKTPDPDKTKAQIASAMVGCWKNWHQGEYDLFTEDGVYCNVCAILKFSPKDGNVEGLEKYLASERLPENKNLTYADYLMAFKTSQASAYTKAIDAESLKLSSFPRDQQYAVIFVHARGSDVVDKMIKQMTSVGGGTLAVAGGGYIAVAAFSISGVAAAVFTAPVAIAGLSIAVVGGGLIYLATGTSVFEKPPEYASQVFFVKYTPEFIKELGCQNSASAV